MHWAPVVIIVSMYAGPADEGKRILQPLREMGTPIGDQSGRVPYVSMQSSVDAMFDDGQFYYWNSLFANNLSDKMIDEIMTLAADKLSPQCLIGLRSLGGAIARVPEGATAYGNRDAQFSISIDNTWQDA